MNSIEEVLRGRRYRRERWWFNRTFQTSMSIRVPPLIRRYTCYKIQQLHHYLRLGSPAYHQLAQRIFHSRTILTVFIIKEFPTWRNPRTGHISYLVNRARHGNLPYPTRIWIPKPDTTEQRPLTVPPIVLRALLKLIVLTMRPLFQTIPQSQHGYRPRFNRITAWQSLLRQWDKYEYVIEFDIRKFFDHVDKRALRRTLLELGLPQSTIRLITNGKYIDKASDTIKEQDQGILQGYPTSPLLALIALHRVTRVHESDTYSYLGYADDGLLLYNSYSLLPANPHVKTLDLWRPRMHYAEQLLKLNILNILSTKLKPIGLTLKPEKTRLIKGRHPQQFTFLGIQRSPSGVLTIDSRSGLLKGQVIHKLEDLTTLYQCPTQTQRKSTRSLRQCFQYSKPALLWKCAQMKHHLSHYQG
jgi:hypothetical protein